MLGFYKKYKFFDLIVEKIEDNNIDFSCLIVSSILFLGISIFISSIVYDIIFK